MQREIDKMKLENQAKPSSGREAKRRINSDDRYRRIFETAQDGILILDAKTGRITDVNPFLIALLGYSREEFLEKKLWEIGPFKDVAAAKSAFKELQRREYIRTEDLPLETKDGRTIEVEFISNVYEVDCERVIQCNIRDISDRKKKEDLSRLNRILRALSSSSQALLHATDETGYMNEVCQVIVNDCGHAMVWIGIAEQDEGKTVRPAACAGFEEGYLDTLKITWADTERGRGPTGTAIRTGKVSMCKNMLTDPNFKPWRAEALKRGYASSLVLPLASGSGPFGAITIYAREVNAFSEDEVRLLSELASDLALGITAFRQRAAREKAEEALAKSEERYRALVENAPIGIGMAALDGRTLAGNEALLRLLGFTQEEFLQINLRDIYQNPADRTRIVQRLQTYRRVVNEKVTLSRKDGTVVPVSLTAAQFAWETGEALLALVEDISERERLEETRNWLASFPELNPSPVVEVDFSGNVHYLNPSARRLFPDLEIKGKKHPWLRGIEPIFDRMQKGDVSNAVRDVRVGQLIYEQRMHCLSETGRVRIYGFDITARDRAEEALRQARDELEMRIQERTQELNKTNERLQVEIAERQRLAQNLHDAVNQSLFSAGLIAEVMPRVWERDQAAARLSLEDLRHLTRGAQAELRALLAELRPSVLAEADLRDLLRQLADAFTGRMNVPVEVRVSGEGALPAEVQVAFYRLCQEGLNNTAKHAEASCVEIDLMYETGAVELRVRDDGRGFDPGQAPPAGHYGLSMMGERAGEVGAALKILSQPGQGTEIIIRWEQPPDQEAVKP